MPIKTASPQTDQPNKPQANPKQEPQKSSYTLGDPTQFVQNMMRVGAQSQKLLGDFIRRRIADNGEGPFDPLNIGGAFMALAHAMSENHEAIAQTQLGLWRDMMSLWESTARKMLGGEAPDVIAAGPGDRRFRDNDWQENEIFAFIKQSYLLTARAMNTMVARLDGLNRDERQRVEFYTRQFADAISPTNFILTNPEVIRTTLQSSGANLVRGLDNLLADIERGAGELSIRQSADSFVLGETIAITPGKVVFRNALFELLQYEPATEQVYARPLLIFPPWINKFYILDLRPENSFIRWLVAQGYTVFVVSWVNPDGTMAQKSFEDYMRDGIFAALDAVRDATRVREVNTVGYCIGGTLLTATLAYMAAHGDTRIHSATFWAAQSDFSEAGDLRVFIDDAQLQALAQQMDEAGGVLKGSKMATTFNMMRANDLIWSFVINNYMLGKTPMPFDLLHWNADSTRMPKRMHLYYLRQCYMENALARGRMEIDGEQLNLAKITVPVYLQSAKDDHIAPFVSVYKTTHLLGGPVRFILAGSGHIAGVINPPEAKKYQYWTNDSVQTAYPSTAEEWRAGATENPGSWWPDWDKWLAEKSGEKIPARKPGDGALPILEDAPGLYVRTKA